MKTLPAFVPAAVLAAVLVSVGCDAPNDISAQTAPPVPSEPSVLQAGTPGVTNAEAAFAAAFDSVYTQVRTASYDSRQGLSARLDDLTRSAESALTARRARGIEISPESRAKIDAAHERASQMFRQLSMATEETWSTARDNAAVALQEWRMAVDQAQTNRPAGI